MTDKLLDMIGVKHRLCEKEVGAFKTVSANGMKFKITAYNAEGLGHVSVMRAGGFFGLMNMDTLIINPTELDLPLYSYDRIYAMSNDTLIVELYDTLLEKCDLSELENVKSGFADLEDRDAGEHWYDSIKLSESISKKGKKAQTRRFDKLATRHLAAYIGAEAGAVENRAEKMKKASIYVEGLIKNGGPSTDAFKKAIGEEKTAELFRKVLFATEV